MQPAALRPPALDAFRGLSGTPHVELEDVARALAAGEETDGPPGAARRPLPALGGALLTHLAQAERTDSPTPTAMSRVSPGARREERTPENAGIPHRDSPPPAPRKPLVTRVSGQASAGRDDPSRRARGRAATGPGTAGRTPEMLLGNRRAAAEEAQQAVAEEENDDSVAEQYDEDDEIDGFLRGPRDTARALLRFEGPSASPGATTSPARRAALPSAADAIRSIRRARELDLNPLADRQDAPTPSVEAGATGAQPRRPDDAVAQSPGVSGRSEAGSASTAPPPDPIARTLFSGSPRSSSPEDPLVDALGDCAAALPAWSVFAEDGGGPLDDRAGGGNEAPGSG